MNNKRRYVFLGEHVVYSAQTPAMLGSAPETLSAVVMAKWDSQATVQYSYIIESSQIAIAIKHTL